MSELFSSLILKPLLRLLIKSSFQSHAIMKDYKLFAHLDHISPYFNITVGLRQHFLSLYNIGL